MIHQPWESYNGVKNFPCLTQQSWQLVVLHMLALNFLSTLDLLVIEHMRVQNF